MTRPQLVREVYFELRRSMAGRATPREMLESAAALVALFTQPEDYGPRFDLRTGGLPFDEWALDTAFADGGWRVLGHETHLQDELLDEEEHERWIHNGMARLAREMNA
jgi:hypothetical protein